ncbi:MAG: PKD domain-containing protein [Sphingobacteriaceae bacterium]|nr:MAG: PKD domain-containing protein [Sphingobacteriaceae bacterium]
MDNRSQKKDITTTLFLNNNFGFANSLTTIDFTTCQPVNKSVQLFNASKQLLIKLACLLTLITFTLPIYAQVTTVNGPSDAVSNPPASASAVSQVLAPGNNISLKIGTSSAASDVIYQWYKMDNTGTKKLVQSSSSTTLQETPSGAGYYTYQLVVSNSNQCSSEISDPFKVYVLPALAPTVAASSSTVCANGTSTALLTANPGSDKYAYQYQWMLNGSAISGATAATYTTPANIASGNNTYTIRVAYALSTSTTGTANQVIAVVPVPTKPTVSIGQ